VSDRRWCLKNATDIPGDGRGGEVYVLCVNLESQQCGKEIRAARGD
jgi:hypothetical protein